MIAWLEFARFLIAFWPIVLPLLVTFYGLCAVYLGVLAAQELAARLEEAFA